MKRTYTIIDAMQDKKVFAQHFKTDTYAAWVVFLSALFALPMTAEQLAIYTKHTGRSTPPSAPLHEAWLVCGRRAGKSFMLSLIAVYLAAFRDWRPYLGPGEVGTIMIVAADRKQARVFMRYCTGLLKAVPMLQQLIVGQTRETISLRNNLIIEVHTASYRTVRGYSCVAAILDEIAFFDTAEDAADPDTEILDALRPSLATVPGSMLLAASSPHARRGALWDNYRKHFGKDGDPVLVWQAATREMHSTVPQSVIDAAMEEDLHKANAEFNAIFRTDVERLLTLEAVEACIEPGCRERAYKSTNSYRAFVDPSGGSADSMTLCIAHYDAGKQTIIIDLLREIKPPFSPEAVTVEFAQTLKSYHLSTVTGDNYAGEYPKEQFSKLGVTYKPAEKNKSALYTDMLAYINSRRIELLDNARCTQQLVSLERRTSRGGRDSIDHPQGGHDDLSNCVAGICGEYVTRGSYNLKAMSDDVDDPDPAAARAARDAFQHARFLDHIRMYG